MTAPLLAIDTATAACSAALILDGAVLAEDHAAVGRGHAERLAPMIAALLARHADVQPSGVLVDCGPGSFTGVRVGLATALGLGLGWGVPVVGLSSTALTAAALFAEERDAPACVVALAGGHGELFVERFGRDPFRSLAPLASLAPAVAAAVAHEALVVGSGAEALVAARASGEARPHLPAASAARLLGPAWHLPPRPIYGRPPDARPIAA